MRIQLLTVAVLSLLGAACRPSEPAPSIPAPEAIFDSQGLKVITSFFNNKQGNISVLYGNSEALNTASATGKQHVLGELFTLVTWKQQEHPTWIGCNINGPVEAIEQVRVELAGDHQLRFNYQFVKGTAALGKQYMVQQQDRIRLITTPPASVFP